MSTAQNIDALPSSTEELRSDDFLGVARSLREVIGKEAAGTQAGCTLSPESVEAFKESGLIWMCVPTELGGGGASIVDGMEVVEELSCIDGSSGWSIAVNLFHTALAGTYLGDEAVDMMFGGNELPIVAGMLGPGGKCIEKGDGYFGGGKFQFGSAMNHATWLGAGLFVMDGDAPRKLPSGIPEVRICFVPKSEIVQKGNWNVTGLEGTGSFDYDMPEQYVPKAFAFERTSFETFRGSPVFKIGLASIACAAHSAIVLGFAKRALIEVVNITSSKKRPGSPKVIAESDVFKYEFGLNEANYHGARAYTYKVFREAQDVVMAGEPIPRELLSRIRQVATWAHQTASDVVRFCHVWSGSEAFRSHTALSRVSRNMAVATQHVFVDPGTVVDSANPIIEAWQAEKY